jgi:NagD protein
MNNVNPDYVIVGEGRGYSLEALERAVRLVLNGARLIGPTLTLRAPFGIPYFLR